MASKAEFLRVWQVLVTSYPNWVKDLSPTELAGTCKIYERVLSDVPGDLLEAAALQHIAASKWFPAVAELRTVALALVETPRRSGMEAWGDVVDGMNRGDLQILPGGNGYHAPQWDDPLVAQAVERLGWMTLFMSENPEADRAHFARIYDALAERKQTDAHMLPVVRELAQRLRADRERAPQLEA